MGPSLTGTFADLDSQGGWPYPAVMPKKKKRDYSSYYEPRLKKDHRAIYDELMAGRIPTMNQALLLAGLKLPPSPLKGLKREWKKAGTADRRKFLQWVRHERGLLPRAAPAKGITGPDGHLLSDVIDSINRIRQIRRLSRGDANVEMGLSRYDYRMSQALGRSAPPKLAVLRALEPWLLKNKALL